MKPVLMHPTYFGPIAQWVAIIQAKELVFENEDNYQKQSYRNRMYIYDANGKLTLNIPIKHSSSLGKHTNGRQKYKEVQIENDFDWQLKHWRGLKASYQTSPFFEFYEDELFPLFDKKFKYLIDFNYHCMQFVADCLQIDWDFSKTEEYFLKPEDQNDFRKLVDAKSKSSFKNEAYTQVFASKHGFLPNLTILDLIFNEGNVAFEYLNRQNLKSNFA